MVAPVSALNLILSTRSSTVSMAATFSGSTSTPTVPAKPEACVVGDAGESAGRESHERHTRGQRLHSAIEVWLGRDRHLIVGQCFSRSPRKPKKRGGGEEKGGAALPATSEEALRPTAGQAIQPPASLDGSGIAAALSPAVGGVDMKPRL